MQKRKSLPAVLILLFLMVLFSETVFADTGKFSTQDCPVMRSGLRIFGRLYLPYEADRPLPLVILSHGLGSNHEIMVPYAQSFAENGIAAFVFDFIGGSEVSLSDGSMSQMSVLTEAEDLICILDRFLNDSRFARDEIFLFGGSQGGFVSAFVAGKRPEDVAGLILLYPAFNLQEISCALIPEDGEVPETARIGEHTVGSVYLKDMQSFDIYEVLAQYPGSVLLFHGTEDPLVPVEYSERAAEVLGDAELVLVEGAGHGFTGEDISRTAARAEAFVRRNLLKINCLRRISRHPYLDLLIPSSGSDFPAGAAVTLGSSALSCK